MLIIEFAAAVLLLLGSGLIFRALIETDSPHRLSSAVRPRRRLAEPEPAVHLPRAA